ncbi:hypothetical protein [Secundilactobacillus kimchicus]|uniref:hypothetical protein n=1 Tax=Secundilactobacillus kimchicus TaxID=528209 RepID=UPI0024A91366|nr:hypothetical protein [Secundilactobacillus kimchicus]
MEKIELTVEDGELNINYINMDTIRLAARLIQAFIRVAAKKLTREEIIHVTGLSYDMFKGEKVGNEMNDCPYCHPISRKLKPIMETPNGSIYVWDSKLVGAESWGPKFVVEESWGSKLVGEESWDFEDEPSSEVVEEGIKYCPKCGRELEVSYD